MAFWVAEKRRETNGYFLGVFKHVFLMSNSFPYTINVLWTFFRDERGSKHGNKFEVWFFRELSSKIAQLPLLYWIILFFTTQKKRICSTLTTIHGWLLLAKPLKGQQWEWSYQWQSDCLSGAIRHYLYFSNSQRCTWLLLTLYSLKCKCSMHNIQGWDFSRGKNIELLCQCLAQHFPRCS